MQSKIMTDEYKTESQNINALITKEQDLIAELEEKVKTYKAVIVQQDFSKIPDSNQVCYVNESLFDNLTKKSEDMPYSTIE